MHQTNTMLASGRDPMREYQKQKEKLALIELECIIDWTKRSMLATKAKANRLNDELSDIHQYLQSLKNEKTTILEDLSQKNAWTKPENQLQTLKLLEINAKIRDAQAAIEPLQEQLLAPPKEIKEMEDYEMKLKTELEEETHKWHSRWPEPEECCMILKLELSRAQAELNAAYQRVEKQFADMELVKPDNTLVDIPCPPRPVHGRGLKIERRSREVGQEIIGDLIAFEDVIPKENGTGNEVPEQTYSADLEDLLTDCQKDSMEGNVAVETRNSDILVDLSAGSTAETSESNTIPKVASTSDDLSVLVTDFPISIMREEGNYCVPETPAIREIEDTVSLLSQYFNQVIKQRFESSDQALQDKETELADLNKVLILMQPLHDIGLAIRKRQVEIDSSKPREQKDQNIIAKGNSAAHHAQVLADATWMMDTTGEAQFQEMYGGISAKIVWERRDFTTFLDILNWNLNMRLFKPTGGLNRTTFGKLFKVVYSRIYPSFEITDKDFEEDRNLKNWLADMRAEHDVANERDRQTRATNRLFLRNQRGMAQQKSKGN